MRARKALIRRRAGPPPTNIKAPDPRIAPTRKFSHMVPPTDVERTLIEPLRISDGADSPTASVFPRPAIDGAAAWAVVAVHQDCSDCAS